MPEGFETLTVTMKPYTSRFLATLCQGAGMGIQGACPFPRCKCPVGLDPLCKLATPEHWDKVLGRAKEECDADNHAHD